MHQNMKTMNNVNVCIISMMLTFTQHLDFNRFVFESSSQQTASYPEYGKLSIFVNASFVGELIIRNYTSY